jgi:hypothetical protein
MPHCSDCKDPLWWSKPATVAQRQCLARYGFPAPATATRGECSRVIDRLKREGADTIRRELAEIVKNGKTREKP